METFEELICNKVTSLDCRLLTLSSIDFLSTSLEAVNKTSSILPSFDAEDVKTLLNAILTNQQTCYDGLQSLPSSVGSVISDLSIPISNNTQLYSVTLAFLTKGWVPKDRNGVPKQPKRHIRFGKELLLLQVGGKEVLVKDKVVVSQDGSGKVENSIGVVRVGRVRRSKNSNKQLQSETGVICQCSIGAGFEGYQDTLYTHSRKQLYRECDIYGTVDFIFGDATVVLQNCNIYPRQPNKGQSNVITAQCRMYPDFKTGISIHNCTIEPTPELASSNYKVKTYLGRPWKKYSRTIYIQNSMGSLIDPAGWLAWSGDFALSTLYYAEYNNTGLGSNNTTRVQWPGYHVINARDAANFTISNFLEGDNWLPNTEVPYTGGLI
ncbi:hypothetical protein ACFX11_019971 [Malus domestica]